MSAHKRKYSELSNQETLENKVSRKKQSTSKSDSALLGYMNELFIFFLSAGIEKARLEIFKTQVKKNGGNWITEYNDNNLDSITHIIVSDNMEIDRAMRIMKITSLPSAPFVRSTWLSLCLKSKCIIPYELHQLNTSKFSKDSKDLEIFTDEQLDVKKTSKTTADFSGKTDKTEKQDKSYLVDDSDYSESDEDSTVKEPNIFQHQHSLPVDKWICAQSSKNPRPNMNVHITNKLQQMVKTYESTNDKWRAFGYQKAIQALQRCPKEISSWEEAMSLQGVGKRLADKIWEIAQSGELRKLQEIRSSEEVQVLEVFTNVWGAGPTTAQQWYQQGFRSIKDLKEKAHLTAQQKVGVRLYDDLLDRMSREEAGLIERVVQEAAQSLQTGIVAQACGSYRRGKATCGDVDVLVTHPDGKSHIGLFGKLLAKLKQSGFITDDLVYSEESGNQKKYLGVCKLQGKNQKHRRLDIIVVPYREYSCALMYFTGSAHFNRSLRHLCKKQNMSLNEHALKSGVVRKGSEKIYEGTIIPTPTERSVFEALNIPYRPPEERDH